MVEAIARSNGETVRIHGAEAARCCRLSTQVPTALVCHTSVSIRTITVARRHRQVRVRRVTLDYRPFNDEFDPFAEGASRTRTGRVQRGKDRRTWVI